MNILPDFLDKIGEFNNFSDDEFLSLNVWLVINCYTNEMALIKNINCEFVAFTDKMRDEFDLPINILGKPFKNINGISNEVSNNIHQQELEIINTKLAQESFYFYKNKQGITNSYIVRKRPLINPNTDNVVGIMVNTEHYSIPNIMRMIFMKHNNVFTNNHELVTNPEFSFLQKQVILCLLIGITGRKEIANTLSQLLSENISEIKVKNTLQQLYRIFDCSDSQQLTNIILSNPSLLSFIEYPIKPGNYLI